jgi:hypothetical protein
VNECDVVELEDETLVFDGLFLIFLPVHELMSWFYCQEV